MSQEERQSLKGYIQHMYLADAYAIQPSLKVRGQPKSASFYGLFFTLVVLGLLLSYFYRLADDLVNHLNPLVYSCDQPGETMDMDLDIFTPDTFQMGFGLVNQTSGLPYMDDTIYTVKASLKVALPVLSTREVQWNTIPLDIEPCKASHTSWDQKFTLSGLWCFKEQQSSVDKLYVRGADDSFISIEFSRCDSSTPNVTCSSDIDAQLRNSTWQAYYTEWAMNPNLYETPMNPRFQSFKAGLPLNLQRKVSMYMNMLMYQTDNGWLVKSTHNITSVGVENINYDFYDRDEKNPVFMSAEIINGGNMLMHMRRYKKLAELFAQVEGLAVVIIPILGLLVIPYSNFKMYEQATNDIYRVPKSGGKHKKSTGKRKGSTSSDELQMRENSSETKLKRAKAGHDTRQIPPEEEPNQLIELQNIFHTLNTKDEANTLEVIRSLREEKDIEMLHKSELENQNRNEDAMPEHESIRIDFPSIDTEKDSSEKSEKEVSQENQDIANQDHKLEEKSATEMQPFSLSYFEWLKSFCRPDPRMKVITQTRNEIEGSIDLVGILKRFMEIDKLKECLLTQEQRVLFDDLRRPIPSMSKKQNKISDENNNQVKVIWKESDVVDVITVDRVYEELKVKKCKTELDMKILALYEERNCRGKGKDL